MAASRLEEVYQRSALRPASTACLDLPKQFCCTWQTKYEGQECANMEGSGRMWLRCMQPLQRLLKELRLKKRWRLAALPQNFTRHTPSSSDAHLQRLLTIAPNGPDIQACPFCLPYKLLHESSRSVRNIQTGCGGGITS